MAAFWLASKLEEVINIDDPNRLTLRNVVTVIDRITRRREGRALTIMDPYSQASAGAAAWHAPPRRGSPAVLHACHGCAPLCRLAPATAGAQCLSPTCLAACPVPRQPPGWTLSCRAPPCCLPLPPLLAHAHQQCSRARMRRLPTLLRVPPCTAEVRGDEG